MSGPRRPHRPEVVVGVDGSPGCRAAVEFAVREAELRDADLVAVMEVRPPAGAEHGDTPAGGTTYAAERHLRSLLESVGTGALEVGLVLTTQPGAEALVDLSHDADLLVVGGHRGRAAPAPIEAEVVSGARCPVVVVRSLREGDADRDADNVARYL